MDTMVHTVPTQVESLHNARMGIKPTEGAKRDLPRKGDFWGMQDDFGHFIETGTVKTNSVGTLVSVTYDRTGHNHMLSANRFNRIGSHEWVVTNA